MSFVARQQDLTSLVFLVLSNLIPLWGVLFYEWSLLTVMFLFWLESGVVGFYALLKMFKVMGPLAVFPGAFLTFHFGGFMTGHLIFILSIFGSSEIGKEILPSFETIMSLLMIVWVPAIGIFVSHGVSFFQNFIGKKEYKIFNVRKLMFMPYQRIIIMHLAIIFGGFLVSVFGNPVLGLVLLIIIKVAVDIFSHTMEHRVR